THVQVKWGYSSIKVRIIPTKEAWARLTSAPSASTARAPRVTNHQRVGGALRASRDRKSTRLNSSHLVISYAVFCLKKKKTKTMSSTHNSLLTGGRACGVRPPGQRWLCRAVYPINSVKTCGWLVTSSTSRGTKRNTL